MLSGSGQEDTIAAIATPPGAGGIGIIRISGRQSLPVLRQVFTPKASSCSFSSHRLYYGHIHDGKKVVDEVMAVFMAAPRSYTCEDVVEIHCHGSLLLLEGVLELVLRYGVRLADPGEFTRRAFLNGRIDLTRAEAVIDILAAKTRKGVELAQQQLAGALFTAIEPVQQALLHACAFVEVAIDFPDEDVEIIDHSTLIRQLREEVLAPLDRLLAQAGRGRLYRSGISLVIAGVPNVGKSSLLNAILQEERALVTAVPGTTRDSIEEVVDIFGVPVRIIDTAGIRQHAGEVEEMGIARARELIGAADLVLFVVDGAKGLAAEDRVLFDAVCHKPVLLVI
ncbi:MAG: tRNA uridine-5-carboxymethylaminomethyl(34) synthesis GTPase MnmE, partial [Desulfobacterales bacterium]